MATLGTHKMSKDVIIFRSLNGLRNLECRWQQVFAGASVHVAQGRHKL